MAMSLSQAEVAELAQQLDREDWQLLRLLGDRGPKSKVFLLTHSHLSRWKCDKALLRLETLRLVTWCENGAAKDYSLTERGTAVVAGSCSEGPQR